MNDESDPLETHYVEPLAGLKVGNFAAVLIWTPAPIQLFALFELRQHVETTAAYWVG